MRNRETSILLLELGFSLLLFLIVNVVNAQIQPIISRQRGLAWESTDYYKVALDFREGRTPRGPGHWVSRIGVPFLASILPGKDLIGNFRVVNIVANALTTLLLVYWLRFFIGSWKVRMLLILLFLLPFNSMARRVYYAPVMLDHWEKFFLLAGLMCLHKMKDWSARRAIGLISLITAVGVTFRGITMLIPLSVLFSRNPIQFNREKFTFGIREWPPGTLYLPLLAGVLGIVFCNLVTISESSTIGTMRLMGRFVYEMLLTTYVLAWFIAYGPILALVIYNWRSGLALLWENQSLFVFLLCVLVFAWIGGASANRYAQWAFPIVYVLMGRAVMEHSRELKSAAFVFVLAVSQIIAQRVFMIWPDHPSDAPAVLPLFTPLGNYVPLLDVLGIGTSVSNFIALNQYLLFTVCTLLYLYYRERRLRKGQPLGALV